LGRSPGSPEKINKILKMIEKQRTIKEPVTLSGVGLHSGKTVTITFRPSAENTGIRFLRTDLDEELYIEADANYVSDTSRGTTLEKEGVKILTVEHVLAAVTGLNIDNVIIETDSIETPIMDGSSKYYVEALDKVGTVEQDAPREYFEIPKQSSFMIQIKIVNLLLFPATNTGYHV
jgi:UDP-3-O-[3-hydroxymyristoyl] N-acetylglucosamine deacetylase / 3-hydroxyacyl-[acyl-carrier-protein] dehydratase